MLMPATTIRSLIPLLLGFLFLLASAGASFYFVQLREGAFRDVRETLRLEGQLNSVQTLITDAETGQRGYLLTGRISYLDPFQLARQRLPQDLDTLAQMIGDEGAQQERLKTLRDLVSKKLAELQETIDMRGNGRGEDAIATVNNNTGATYMAQIRDLLAQMRASSQESLQARQSRATALSRSSQYTLIFGAVLVVVLAAFALKDGLERIRLLEQSNARLTTEMSERKSAESQVRQLQKMEAVGQLTGGIAHDFNNMLAIIVGSLNLARRRLTQGDTEKSLSFIESALEGAQRATTLTARLLAFSRLQPLEPKVVDPSQLIGNMSDMLRRTLGETIHVETVFGGGLWRVFADPGQIESALVNLAVNARDAMPSGGKLTIETANVELDEQYARSHNEVTAGQYVMISMTDTGVGMAPQVVERAFDPFYTTKGAGKGTGLGLSQVYGFVKQSKGHVKLYSEVGQGTTVKIYLPRFSGQSESESPGLRAQKVPRALDGEVILVVEDDDAVRRVTVDSLRDLGYAVVHAGKASRALEILETEQKISLLFTDIVMPDMNGRQLADKAREIRPDLPVLFTTGYTRNAIVHNGMLDPGTALIGKPFTLEQLGHKVREVLVNG